MTFTDEQATEVLRAVFNRQRLTVSVSRPAPVTQAHRDEIVRNLQHGAMSFRALCVYLDRYAGERVVDRGLVKRTLHSAVDRGEVIAVLVRRPGLTQSHRERRPFYVYAPAPHLLLPEGVRDRNRSRQVLRARRAVL